MVHTDPVQAGRVLPNMMKNAAEAPREGGEVRLGVACRSDAVRFEVWNEGRIPEHVAAQIFKRSFSTKGASGRDLGTWSMRMKPFGEEYLGGRVDFQTGAEGTTFSSQLPAPPVRSGTDIS